MLRWHDNVHDNIIVQIKKTVRIQWKASKRDYSVLNFDNFIYGAMEVALKIDQFLS